MRDPPFWWRNSAAAVLLSPLGLAYGAFAAARLREAGASAGVPVICVGNFTLGGTGKTPTALTIARLLKGAGERPHFLTRGYGGQLSGPVLISEQDSARDTGDEALLLARVAPTIVARDRVRGAALAKENGASVIVMDDGLQNPSLKKDLALAVVDGPRGIGNGLVFPAGPLRAPLAAQLELVRALLVIGEPAPAHGIISAAMGRPIQLHYGRLAADPAAVANLRGRKVLAFAGIGRPDKFFTTLTQEGIELAGKTAFADHHRFSASEAALLLKQADAQGLTLVTTEKDRARMAGDPALAELRARVTTLPVTLALDDEKAFAALILSALRQR